MFFQESKKYEPVLVGDLAYSLIDIRIVEMISGSLVYEELLSRKKAKLPERTSVCYGHCIF